MHDVLPSYLASISKILFELLELRQHVCVVCTMDELRQKALADVNQLALSAFLTATFVALVATPRLRRLAFATGFVDQPMARKDHPDATPYLGGVAIMLGVRRPTITLIIGSLEKAGLIANGHRGEIVITDRKKLEAASCECYATVRANFARLLPEVGAAS